METISNICSGLIGLLILITPISMILFIILSILKKKKAKVFGIITAVLAMLFLPLVIIGGITSPTARCEHQYVEVKRVEPQIGIKGKITKECELCGKKITDTIPALESSSTEPDISVDTENDNETNNLTDIELANIRKVFSEKIGKELEETPQYCGTWTGGKRYKTVWFFYGYHLIYMDSDGYVNTVVWVQEKDGDEGRFTLYSRSDDPDAPEITSPNDGIIHLIDGQIGEYGTIAETGYIHYKIPKGTYTIRNEVNFSTVFVVCDTDPNDVRYTIWLKEHGEEAIIEVAEDAHIELSASSQVAFIEITE